MIDINFHEQVTYFHTLYLIFNKYFPFVMDRINQEDSVFIQGRIFNLKNSNLINSCRWSTCWPLDAWSDAETRYFSDRRRLVWNKWVFFKFLNLRFFLGVLLKPDIYQELVRIFDMGMMNSDRRNMTDMLRYFNQQLFEDLIVIFQSIPCIRPSTEYFCVEYAHLFNYFEYNFDTWLI